MGKNKIVILGLDGADPKIIENLHKRGKIKNLSKLISTGSYGHLHSTILPSSEQAWVSFYTGKNNAKHNIYNFIERIEKTYRFKIINSTSVKSLTIWDILSKRGYKIGIINFPITYPPRKINGYCIGGFLSPDLKSDFIYPENFKKEILENFPHYIIEAYEPKNQTSYQENIQYLNKIIEMINIRKNVAIYSIKNHPVDIFGIVFRAIDVVQHKFWKFYDKTYPGYEYDPVLSEAIEKVYLKIDQAIGEIINHFNKNTHFIVLSDHGGGPLLGCFLVNNFLENLGYLNKQKKIKYQLQQKLLNSLNFIMPDKIKDRLRVYLMKIFPNFFNKLISDLSFNDIDWRNTKAYGLLGLGVCIYINLKSREALGTIEENSKEYNELINFIKNKLNDLKDPDTKEPILEKIYFKKEVYKGKYLKNAPDIIGLFNNCQYKSIIKDLDDTGKILLKKNKNPFLLGDISGMHSLFGIAILKGPQIKKKYSLQNIHICDLAPSIFYLLDEPIPNDFDGKIIEDAFIYKKNINYCSEKNIPHLSKESSNLDNNDEVQQRLKNLGYLE